MEFLAKSVEPEVAVTLDPGYRSFPAPQWDIFIAHAGADAPRARQLFQYLAVSCKPFLDAECIRPGDRWDIELATAQRSSRVTVILVSSSTTGAMYAREEASVAVALHRSTGGAHRVIPVYLDGRLDVVQNTIYGIFNFQSSDAVREGGLEAIGRKLIALLAEPAAAPAARAQLPQVSSHPLMGFRAAPALEPFLVRKVLIQAYAEAIPAGQAALTLDEAIAARVESEPGNPEVRYLRHSEIPSPLYTPALVYWTEVFRNACLYGPRMVAALLHVVDPVLLPPAAQQARMSLLDRLQ